MKEKEYMRLESDSIGTMEVPEDAYYGVQALRAKENFPITGTKLHPVFIKNLAKIKRAAAITNRKAGRLKQEAQQESFSVVCVHAWSNFSDHGQTEDPLIENQSGDIRGAGAAKLCAGHLNDSFEVVNMQELVWRLRMSQRPEQTKKYLSEVF